jgi:hypothetical protein
VPLDSPAIAMFRVDPRAVPVALSSACGDRGQAQGLLANHRDSRLMTVPGIGPSNALTNYRRGPRSAPFRPSSSVPEVLWRESVDPAVRAFSRPDPALQVRQRALAHGLLLAAQSAVRMRENSLRRKFHDYVHHDALNPDLRRKALRRWRPSWPVSSLASSRVRLTIDHFSNTASKWMSPFAAGRWGDFRPRR